MARKKGTKASGSDADEVIDLTKEEAEGAASKAKEAGEQVTDEPQKLAGRQMLREAGYAAIGAGDLVAEAARSVDAASVQQRLRRTPRAVAWKASKLGATAQVKFVELAARGHRVRLEAAGGAAAEEAGAQVEAAKSQAKDAAETAREGAEQAAERTGDAAEEVSEKGKQAQGRLKGAARSATKAAAAQSEAARSVAKKFGRGSKSDDGGSSAEAGEAETDADQAGTDADEAETDEARLEDLTVAQLRERADELGIEGGAKMRKKQLIEAIKDAG